VVNPAQVGGEFLVFLESCGGVRFFAMLRMGCRGDTSPIGWLTFVNLRLPLVNLLQPREISSKNAGLARSLVYER
jgi:hypothetical protein